jgi:hypothetical protein
MKKVIYATLIMSLSIASCKKDASSETNLPVAEKSVSLKPETSNVPIAMRNAIFGNRISIEQAKLKQNQFFTANLEKFKGTTQQKGVSTYPTMLSSNAIILSSDPNGCGSVEVTAFITVIYTINCNQLDMTFTTENSVGTILSDELFFGGISGGDMYRNFVVKFQIPSLEYFCSGYSIYTQGYFAYNNSFQNLSQVIIPQPNGPILAATSVYGTSPGFFKISSSCDIICYPACYVCPTNGTINYYNVNSPNILLSASFTAGSFNIYSASSGNYNYTGSMTYPNGVTIPVGGSFQVN